MKETFTAAADGKTTYRREKLPDPAHVAGAGIATRESLAWKSQYHPEPPKLTYELDQEAARQAALDFVRAGQRQEVAKQWEEFLQKPEKARQDFGLARDYRGPERER